MSRIFFVLLSSFTALVMGLASLFQPNSPNSPTDPTQTAVIDFEGLAEGTIVSSVTFGAGISGDDLGGYVGVSALNPNFPGQNAAMIFDSTCPPENTPAGCSGQDSDLFFPALGNILIISEDLDTSDPDDADLPDAYYDFDFSTWGAGVVTIDSIVVGDVEDVEDPGADNIFMYSGGLNGVLLGTYDITSTGNNQYQTFNINQPGVDYMRIDLNGSGAIDNIKLSVEETAIELLDFHVQSFTQDNVTLVWETAAEIDNVGFNLYRSADANLANAQLIHFEPAAGSSGGHQYVYTDSIPNAGAWWYWLADVDTTAGETYHGPVSTLGMAVMNNFLFVPILATE